MDSNNAPSLGDLTDLATPFAVRTAATLRVPDRIAAGVDRLDDLAAACAADRDALARLLRHLVHRGVFTEPEPDRFGLTDLGRQLRDDAPGGHRRWLDLTDVGFRIDMAFRGLLHSVRTGEEGYSAVHGRTFWDDLDAEPAHQRFLDELMIGQHRVTAPQVAKLYEWDRVDRVVDVGGGSGALLVEILRAHPHLHGTLVDRPQPAAATRARFAGHDLAGRMDIVDGDFFTSLPPGGDVYVISRAVTDWNDRAAARILRCCGEAAGSAGAAGPSGTAGRILIVEVLPSEPHVPHATRFDLEMLVVVGGRERTLADFETLAADAGLAVTRVLRGDDRLVLIECAPHDRS